MAGMGPIPILSTTVLSDTTTLSDTTVLSDTRSRIKEQSASQTLGSMLKCRLYIMHLV